MSISILKMQKCEGECGALVRNGRYCEECMQLMRDYAEAEPEETRHRIAFDWSGLDREDVGVVPMRRAAQRITLSLIAAAGIVVVILCWIGGHAVARMLFQ